MDGFRFDQLTKKLAARLDRRQVLAASAALAGVSLATEPGAARKKGEKERKVCVCADATVGSCRTKKVRASKARKLVKRPCNYRGKCRGVSGCTQDGVTQTPSCGAEGATCTSGEVCCSGSCDFLVVGGTCSPCRGRSCNAKRPCCGGLNCTAGFCGGCRDRAVSCSADAQCCYSNCTGGACLSAQGGPCARDVDCRACYLQQNCTNACGNGTCTV